MGFRSACSLAWRILILFVVLTPATVEAGLLVPAGVNPGDTYHLAFTPDWGYRPTDGDINYFNGQMQYWASQNPSETGTADGVEWHAIVSTTTVDARDNALVQGAVYLMNGTTKIADSYSDFWDGSLDAPLNLDQYGSTVPSALWAWTGTISNGTKSAYPFGSATTVTYGSVNAVNSHWINFLDSSQSNFRSIYALSGPIAVGGVALLPEPNCMVLLTLGTGAMAFARRRRLRSASRSG